MLYCTVRYYTYHETFISLSLLVEIYTLHFHMWEKLIQPIMMVYSCFTRGSITNQQKRKWLFLSQPDSFFVRYLRKKEYPSTVMTGKGFRKTSREGKGTNERRTRKQTKRWAYANRRRNWYSGRLKFTRLLLLLVKQQAVIWIKIFHEHGDMRLGDVERTTTADVVAFRSATNDKDQR